MFLLVAGHDLIVLLYTRAYEKSANIFLVTIILLPFSIFLLDPIVRAYKDLRNFVLGAYALYLRWSFLRSLTGYPPFWDDGRCHNRRCSTDDGTNIFRWKVVRVVDATRKDLCYIRTCLRSACTTIAAGLVAYVVRNLISPNRLIPRIAAVSIVSEVESTCRYVRLSPSGMGNAIQGPDHLLCANNPGTSDTCLVHHQSEVNKKADLLASEPEVSARLTKSDKFLPLQSPAPA